MKVIEFPRMKKADELSEKLISALVKEAHKQGLDTLNADFVYDMAWVSKFIKAAVDNQCNIEIGRAHV